MTTPFDPARQQASTVCLPPGNWATVLDCLCDHFKAIDRAQWLDRFARGRVLDAEGRAVSAGLPYKRGMRLHYFREVPNERPIPVQEVVLHVDEHLVVADKPHFLPVTPTGEYVEQTLLRRLIRRLGNPHWCRCTVSTGIPPGLCCFPPTRRAAVPTSGCSPNDASTSATRPLRGHAAACISVGAQKPSGAWRAVFPHA